LPQTAIMHKKTTLLLVLIIHQLTFSQIVINEVDCDTASTDTQEFIELKTVTPYYALDGYVVVLFKLVEEIAVITVLI